MCTNLLYLWYQHSHFPFLLKSLRCYAVVAYIRNDEQCWRVIYTQAQTESHLTLTFAIKVRVSAGQSKTTRKRKQMKETCRVLDEREKLADNNFTPDDFTILDMTGGGLNITANWPYINSTCTFWPRVCNITSVGFNKIAYFRMQSLLCFMKILFLSGVSLEILCTPRRVFSRRVYYGVEVSVSAPIMCPGVRNTKPQIADEVRLLNCGRLWSSLFITITFGWWFMGDVTTVIIGSSKININKLKINEGVQL